jgi:hypothetical protein
MLYLIRETKMQHTDKSKTDKKTDKTRMQTLIMRTMTVGHTWFLKGRTKSDQYLCINNLRIIVTNYGK